MRKKKDEIRLTESEWRQLDNEREYNAYQEATQVVLLRALDASVKDTGDGFRTVQLSEAYRNVRGF